MAFPICLPISMSLLLLFLISSVSTARGGVAGVDYGRVADNLMPPREVVKLLRANGIVAVSIYDADPAVLRAFRGSGIRVVVALPNELLAAAAGDWNFTANWVRRNVDRYYPSVRIHTIAVGNEVFHQSPNLTSFLLPAMKNVYAGLAVLGLADDIKVSSPVAINALSMSFPPSLGRFRSELEPVLRQMLDFLDGTGSYFMVNPYPYMAYVANPSISLKYALGLPNPGVLDPVTNLTYHGLLDAQLDAFYSAIAAIAAPAHKAALPSLSQAGGGTLKVTETGWPSTDSVKYFHPHLTVRPAAWRLGMERSATRSLAEGRSSAATKANARAYNGNLIKRVLAGRTGTPLHPDADIDVNIFSLFNENQKPGPETERNYGLFYPNGTKVYGIQFRAWCVAVEAAGAKRLQAALDFACGPGGADCGAIQPGAPCFEPNSVVAHASYAMNNYYQAHDREGRTCDFAGTARVVFRRPVFGNCSLPSSARGGNKEHDRTSYIIW